MRVYKKIGTKERLFEMFENVNKGSLNEDVNSPSSEISEPDTNSVYKLNDKLWNDFEVERVSLANNHKNVVNQWKFKENKQDGHNPDGSPRILNHWENVGNPNVIWSLRKENMEKTDSINNSTSPLKENVAQEIGTDSGIFHMLYSYFSRNMISNEEFPIGELTVQLQAEPTTWDDVPYSSASRMQPEEGGHPENVKGEITDIVIWDKEGNEYRLSDEAFTKLNSSVRGFEGNLYDELAEKAANGGEDQFSRADFARKDSMENESFIKEDNNVTEDVDFNSEIIRHDKSPEEVEKEFMDEPLKFTTSKDGGMGGTKYKTLRQATTNGLRTDETSYTDLAKSTGDVDMMKGVRFNYDQKGNWIPEGHEDKKVALRPLEQPLGSDNWKVALVTLDDNGDLDHIIKTTNTWQEAKNALHASIT